MATDLQKEFCSLRDTYIEKQFGRLNEMPAAAIPPGPPPARTCGPCAPPS